MIGRAATKWSANPECSVTATDGSKITATSEILQEIGDLKQQRRHMKHQQSRMVARS